MKDQKWEVCQHQRPSESCPICRKEKKEITIEDVLTRELELEQSKGSKSEEEFMNFMENNGVKFIDVTPKDPDMIIRKLPKESEIDWKKRYCKEFGLCKDGEKCQCKAELKFIENLLASEKLKWESEPCRCESCYHPEPEPQEPRDSERWAGETQPEGENWKERYKNKFEIGVENDGIRFEDETGIHRDIPHIAIIDFIQQELDKSYEEGQNNCGLGLSVSQWLDIGKKRKYFEYYESKLLEEERARKYGGVSEWILYGEKYHFTEFLIGKEKKKWVEEIESLKDQLLKSTKD